MTVTIVIVDSSGKPLPKQLYKILSQDICISVYQSIHRHSTMRPHTVAVNGRRQLSRAQPIGSYAIPYSKRQFLSQGGTILHQPLHPILCHMSFFLSNIWFQFSRLYPSSDHDDMISSVGCALDIFGLIAGNNATVIIIKRTRFGVQ